MPNTLWLWVFRALSSQGILSQRLRGGLLSNDKSRTLNLSSQPFMVVGGGLFIATWQPDLICPKWPWVTKELTRVPTVRFQTHTATLLGLQAKLTCPTFDKIRQVFTRRHRFCLSITLVILTGSLGPHLTVWWFLWLNKEEKKATKPHSLRAS